MTDNTSQPKLWTRDFLLIFAANFLLFTGFQTLPFALPVYLSSLGAPDSMLGWVTAIATVAAILVRPFCGAVLDRFGRKGVFLAGILFMGLTTAAYAFFPFMGAVLGIRFMQGLAWGIASTASQTIATDTVPTKRFAEGMGFFAISASFAFALAPGLALELFNWQGIQPVLIFSVGAFFLVFILALAMRYKDVERSTSFTIRNLYEKQSIAPSLIAFVLTMCYGALVTFLALHATAQGLDGVGPFFLIYAVGIAVSRPLAGKIIDRKGYAITLMPSLLMVCLALVILSFADSLLLFSLVAALFGTGFASCNSTLQAMAVSGVEPNRRGAANATYLTGFDSGIGVGSLIAGLIATALGYSGLYLAFAALPLVAAALYFLIARKRKPPHLA